MAVRLGQPVAWIRAITLALVGGIDAGCGHQPIAVGPAAADAFLYRGSPVHPFCVDFPQEKLSRTDPMDLAACTDHSITPRLVRGTWLSADRPPVGDRGGGSVEYRVLASAGDRFLLAVESSGGGSGSFSELFWVRLTDRAVTIDRDELGGDRCAGGMSGYSVTGDTLRFYATASTRKLIALTGVSLPDTIRRQLRDAYYACDGAENYVYDLRSRRMTVETFTLTEPGERVPSAGPGETSAQKCFDALASEYASRGRLTLTPAEFRQFGADFAARCAR
jgi:hypothetical protein